MTMSKQPQSVNQPPGVVSGLPPSGGEFDRIPVQHGPGGCTRFLSLAAVAALAIAFTAGLVWSLYQIYLINNGASDENTLSTPVAEIRGALAVLTGRIDRIETSLPPPPTFTPESPACPARLEWRPPEGVDLTRVAYGAEVPLTLLFLDKNGESCSTQNPIELNFETNLGIFKEKGENKHYVNLTSLKTEFQVTWIAGNQDGGGIISVSTTMDGVQPAKIPVTVAAPKCSNVDFGIDVNPQTIQPGGGPVTVTIHANCLDSGTPVALAKEKVNLSAEKLGDASEPITLEITEIELGDDGTASFPFTIPPELVSGFQLTGILTNLPEFSGAAEINIIQKKVLTAPAFLYTVEDPTIKILRDGIAENTEVDFLGLSALDSNFAKIAISGWIRKTLIDNGEALGGENYRIKPTSNNRFYFTQDESKASPFTDDLISGIIVVKIGEVGSNYEIRLECAIEQGILTDVMGWLFFQFKFAFSIFGPVSG